MKFMLRIVAVVFMVVAFASAREFIVFNGIVQDDSFEKDEKLNVEILETGEALQTTVGNPFSVVLPEDTLWNVCVTNSDTAGAEKEKCYELIYLGSDSTFSMVLGEAGIRSSRIFALSLVFRSKAWAGEQSATNHDSGKFWVAPFHFAYLRNACDFTIVNERMLAFIVESFE